jgi:hypothetical protein
MKTSAILGLLVILTCGSGCSNLDRTHGERVALIEFEREEDNGLVNIVPCRLVLSDRQTITLTGGDRRVVFVLPGEFFVTAFSEDPYSPRRDSAAWRSSRTRFHVGAGQRLRIIVEPAAVDSTYSGGWTIRAANHRVDRTAAGPRRFATGWEGMRRCRDAMAGLTAAVGHSNRSLG